MNNVKEFDLLNGIGNVRLDPPNGRLGNDSSQ